MNIHSYTGTPFDVAFEINTEDSFLAGIAIRILEEEKISRLDRKLLKNPRLSENNWRCDDGQLFDLEPYPEILSAARGVEEFRSKCQQALDERISGPIC